jgi:hypothetical protein
MFFIFAYFILFSNEPVKINTEVYQIFNTFYNPFRYFIIFVRLLFDVILRSRILRFVTKATKSLNLLVTEERYWALVYMPLYTFLQIW